MTKYGHMGTTECDKSIVRSDVDITQCGNGTVKCEKKNRVPLNVKKSTNRCDVGTT